MTSIRDVIKVLETKANPSLQESYDNSGLITGSLENEVSAVLISLDCTENVVEEAIKMNCNLIISHHPILFKPISRLTGANYVERTIIKAVQNDIALYSIHTNLDSVSDGVNAKMASVMGLVNCRILRKLQGRLVKLVTFCPIDHVDSVREAIFNAGSGQIGNYDHCSFNVEGIGTFRAGDNTDPYVGKKHVDHSEKEVRIESVFHDFDRDAIVSALLSAHPYEEVAYDLYQLLNTDDKHGMGMIGELESEMKIEDFLEVLKKKFKTGIIRHTTPVKDKVKLIAICGGSGSFLISDAIAQKADVFVTSDIKYHDFFDADSSIVLADIGHFESEQFTVDIIAEELTKKFTNFATHFSTVNTNPINYF